MCAATMEIGRKARRIEEREDGLWYLTNPQDQAELGSQGKPYMEWYEQSDMIVYSAKHPSTMCYS